MHFVLSTAFNSACELFLGTVSLALHSPDTQQQKVSHELTSELEGSEEPCWSDLLLTTDCSKRRVGLDANACGPSKA